MELRTKSMLIIEPIAKQVALMDCHNSNCSPVSNTSFNIEKEFVNKVEKVCCSLINEPKQGLDRHITILKTAFSEFQRVLDKVQDQYKINIADAHVFKELLLALHELLIKKDTLAVEIICTSIEDCQSSLQKLEEATSDEEIKEQFEHFGSTVVVSIDYLKLRIKELLSLKQRNLIALCADQISKCLPLLQAVLKQDCGSIPKTSKPLKCYVMKRIAWCFSELLSVLQAPKPTAVEESEGFGVQFVHRMNLALDLLSSVRKDIPVAELKPVIDEVLCHAMSIAQVAVPLDGKAITASCHKVLQALDELKEDCHTLARNPFLCNIYADLLAVALETLELRVNTALLRLVLEVFCDSFSPLKKLLMACKGVTPERDRHSQDLEEMITVFDLQMDRIMQIGWFAMACSKDVKRVLVVRSCLASLESLEPELIPALTAFYLEPSSVSSKSYLKELVMHWRSEVKELQIVIDGIVDPAAFCQVAIQDVHTLVANLKSKIYETNAFIIREMIGAVHKRAKKVIQQVKISNEDVEPQYISTFFHKTMGNLELACHECYVAMWILLLPGGNERLDLTGRSRLLKRCELVLSVMKKLHPLITEMITNSTETRTVYSSNESLDDENEKLQRSGNRRGLADEDKTSVILPPGHEGAIVPYLLQGKLLGRERSILYFTPKKLTHPNPVLRPLSAHRLPSSPSQHFGISKTAEADVMDHTLSLEITCILDNLTSLSNTLTSDCSGNDISEASQVNLMVENRAMEASPKDSRNDHEEIAFLFNLENNIAAGTENYSTGDTGDGFSLVSMDSESKAMFSTTINGSLTSHEVNTPQRMEDLKTVQEKIAALKINF